MGEGGPSRVGAEQLGVDRLMGPAVGVRPQVPVGCRASPGPSCARGGVGRPSAERFFRDGLAIRERLAATDPTNAGFQRDLSVSFERMGDLLIGTGQDEQAVGHYRSTNSPWPLTIAGYGVTSAPAKELTRLDAVDHLDTLISLGERYATEVMLPEHFAGFSAR